MLKRNQNDLHAINVFNISIGFLRVHMAGVLGVNLSLVDSNETVRSFLSGFTQRLSSEWKEFINTAVDTSKYVEVFTYNASGNQVTGLFDATVTSELKNYANENVLQKIQILAFRLRGTGNQNILVVASAESVFKGRNIKSYVFGMVGPKNLNEYIYFTNREIRPGGSTIYFVGADYIDGPLRSYDYININNVGGNPTFKGTIEVLGIRDRNGNIVNPTSYNQIANLQGTPPYRLLTSDDISSLSFQNIRDEYDLNIQRLVNTYDWVRNNTSILTGLKFNGDITINFNHGQGASNYDMKISQGNVDYIITWNPSPPFAKIRRQGGGPAEEFNFLFNGVVVATGNISIDGPTALSTYFVNYTLYAHGDVLIRDKIIPKSTYDHFFDAREHSSSAGIEVSALEISQIKDFLTSNEKSSLNIVARNNVRIAERLNNMKIFASLFAFDGAFTVDNYNLGSANGQLLVFGSIMQNLRGPVGTFNPSTGQILTSYKKTCVYDPRIVTAAYQPVGTPTKSQTLTIKMLGMAN